MTTRPFTPTADTYAATLLDAGFTVYIPADQPGRPSHPVGWFHYSRDVDGVTCYGTFNDGSDDFDGPRHFMPITPSRLNGSSAIIGGQWGDLPTLNLDNRDPLTVAYALAVARPSNWCPFAYQPTPDYLARANAMGSLPKRAFLGARLSNAKPWGIGTRYLPVTVNTAEVTA